MNLPVLWADTANITLFQKNHYSTRASDKYSLDQCFSKRWVAGDVLVGRGTIWQVYKNILIILYAVIHLRKFLSSRLLSKKLKAKSYKTTILPVVLLKLKLNPWRYSSEEPRPTEAVAAIWQYRGPCD